MTTFDACFLENTFRKFSIAAKYFKSSEGARDIARSAVRPRKCPRVGLELLLGPVLKRFPGFNGGARDASTTHSSCFCRQE